MTKKEILHIEETFSVLMGQPMRLLERIGPNLVASFGELIEIDTIKLGGLLMVLGTAKTGVLVRLTLLSHSLPLLEMGLIIDAD